jgi:V8-like Glu-specific endopeptidase
VHDSGAVANTGSRTEVVISFTVQVPGAEWVRLYCEDIVLAGSPLTGDGSLVRYTSWKDGDVQEMSAIHVAQWRRSSAYFNGDTVQVEVFAHPGTGVNRVVTASVDAGVAPPQGSQCGATDDRVLSQDPRAARLLPIGCTGWLIDDCNNCFLTAGHCSGNIQVVQFNVPLSNGNGGLNNPPAADQYATDPASLQSNGGQGVGNDYAYFGCFANSNTGLTPAQAQGAVYQLAQPPASTTGNNIRITGYGTDGGTSNQVQQTHVGPFVNNSGTQVGYVTDTTGGNSGSPVIWEETGFAIGIHTHGGCNTDGSGNNWGTGTNNSGLQALLANPLGVCSGVSLALPGGPPASVPAGQPTPLTVNVGGGSPTTVELYYRLNGGLFSAVAMAPIGGGNWQADLPAPACGDAPDFYFAATDATCGVTTLPSGAPGSYFSTAVGTLSVALADDFEADQGWTVENLGATSGGWERGIPVDDNGWAYDPPSDGDGSGRAYLTQNQVGNTDVDNGAVRLSSPSFDLSDGNGSINYSYYLNLTNADGSDRLLVEVSSNGAAGPWTTVATHATNGGLLWRAHVIDDATLTAAGVSQTADMRVRFTANDGGTQSIVEAGVDGFLAGALTCGAGPLGSSYCQAELNSTGFPAVIAATGSPTASDDDLTLTASLVPDGQFAYFLGSQTQAFVQNPAGSEGNLCVGGNIARFTAQIGQTAGSEFSIQVDTQNVPQNPTGPIVAGETWNFTCWFRDQNPGATSNFTNGVSIQFQ